MCNARDVNVFLVIDRILELIFEIDFHIRDMQLLWLHIQVACQTACRKGILISLSGAICSSGAEIIHAYQKFWNWSSKKS